MSKQPSLALNVFSDFNERFSVLLCENIVLSVVLTEQTCEYVIYKVKKLRALARGVFVFAVAAVRIFSDVAFSFVIFKLPFGRTEIL